MKRSIDYVVGDATRPMGTGYRLIPHICNDEGGWGRGFVLALSQRWAAPEQAYLQWYRSGENFALGEIQAVEVEDELAVINMIAQHGVAPYHGVPPIRYHSLSDSLEQVAILAKEKQASVHMPRIGAGLAGGRWEIIEQIIQETLGNQGIAVTVYDLER